MERSLDHQYFVKYFNNFKKFDAKAFDLALQHVDVYATEHGLTEEDLILISKVSFNQQLGVTRLRKLMKCLIPRYSVPDEVVEYVLNWLLENFKRNISPFAKKIVLQWFIGLIQYNIINPAKTIYLYYDLLWYFLPYEIVNVAACNLIYLLAKPEDVSRWYVKQILKVHRINHEPKYTGALLLLFKSYRPDCVPENIPAYAVHKAFGTLPEAFVTNLRKAQERLEQNNMIPKDVEGIQWYSTDIRFAKKTAVQLIPNITESELSKLDGSKTLTSITNVKDLHKYLIQGHAPQRLLSLLHNTEGCFILIFGDHMLQDSFSFQLYYTLYDAFFERNQNVSYEERDNLLNKICILQNLLQQSIPVVSKFLALYIIKWDGFEHETHIYGLLHWFHFKSYIEFHESILKFLYDLFISGTVETKSKILTTLGHFTANIIKTHYCRIKNERPGLFLDGKIKWQFQEIIHKLYKYITHLCKLGLVFEKSSTLILNAIIDVNYLIMYAEERCCEHIWTLPSFLCSAVLFCSHPSSFIKIFKLFNRFPSYVNETVKKDYINSLWNRKAFESKNEESVFNIFSDTDKQQLREVATSINDTLSCERHLAVACFNYPLRPRIKNDIQEIEEFVEHAKICYPDFVQFLVNNIFK